MKLSHSGRTGILVAVLLAGCSPSAETTSTDPAPTTSAAPTMAGSAASGSPTTGVGQSGTADTAPTADLPGSEPTPTSAAPGPEVPSVAAPQPPGAAAPDPIPSAPAAGAAPEPAPNAAPAPAPSASFPDPAEVEARGLATNPLCEVLSVDEVTTLVGAPVAHAVDTADGTACLWSGTASDSTYLQLQMLGDPARYLPPADAESVPGIGDAAFVVRSTDGWTAQAQNPDGTFAVQIAGNTAGRDATIQGLRLLLERY
jgi:hypothetical protein